MPISRDCTNLARPLLGVWSHLFQAWHGLKPRQGSPSALDVAEALASLLWASHIASLEIRLMSRAGKQADKLLRDVVHQCREVGETLIKDLPKAEGMLGKLESDVMDDVLQKITECECKGR